MTRNTHRIRTLGFSLVESLSAVAILAVLTLIAVPLAQKIKPATQHTKTQTSVSQLNTAIDFYITSGGNLDTAADPSAVLNRLKTRMNSNTAASFVGFSGSAIDQKLITVPVAANDPGARAVYNASKKQFEVTTQPVAGVRFDLDENYSGTGIADYETREAGNFQYAKNSTWVWDYTEAVKVNPLEITAVTQTPTSSPIPVSLYTPETPEGPGTPELKKLLPPVFSLPGGSYELGNYPMSLEIINPNEAGQIIYGLVSEGSWGWNEYTEPIVINPGTEVVAYVASWRPQQYHNSSTTHAKYDYSAQLNSPWFTVSENAISEVDGVATIEIEHNNDPGYYSASGLIISDDPFEIQYRITPLVAGQGVETAWQAYEDPFEVAAVEFTGGFTVHAKVVSSHPGISESWVVDTSVSTFDPNNPPGSELEFSTTNISLNVGDSFNIRDYVRVKSDPTAEVDWSRAFFTYTEAGANNPPNPADWNLDNFNSGAPVVVTAADMAPTTGNNGDGIYQVYLARNDVAAFDDVLTVTISEAPAGPGLSPPIFDPEGGYFQTSEFPLLITLNDPNPPGRGKIVYTIDGVTTDYTAPFNVDADTEVFAHIESLDEAYSNSIEASENYQLSTEPYGPWVWVSNPEIDLNSGSTSIYIGFTNTSHLDYEIQYKLTPLVAGQGEETPWTTYNGGFNVGAPQFPKGFEVASKIVPSDPEYSEILGEVETVVTFAPLLAPTIASNIDTITDRNPVAQITLANPNPAGSSSVVYQVLATDGTAGDTWLPYSAPFSVNGPDYPNGVKILAKAIPTDDTYRESSEAQRAISGKFFDVDVTYKTIFVLDTSGSMVTNDRITRLKNQVISVIESFGEDDSFAIIDYDSGASVVSGWGNGSESRKQAAIAAVSAMEADGATNYHAALQAAINLSAADATQVIYLSDGLPFAPDAPNPEDTDGIIELVNTIMATSVERLDTIAVGVSSQILQDMAAAGGGESVIISD